MSASEETIALLTSIDASLKSIAKALIATAGKAVASDEELDGRYGDQEVRFMPRDWIGPSYKGRTFSECPPDLLDLLARAYDYFAEKDEREGAVTAKGKPMADYKRRDAALARGWAARARSGRTTPGAPKAAPEAEEVPLWAAGDDDEKDVGF